MNEAPAREAADDEIAAWAAELWLYETHGADAEMWPGDDHVQIQDGLIEADELLIGAREALSGKQGVTHLLSQVQLWIHVDSNAGTSGAVMTVDLPDGTRLCSQSLDLDDLVPDVAWIEGMNVRSLYEELTRNVLGIARRLVSEHAGRTAAAEYDTERVFAELREEGARAAAEELMARIRAEGATEGDWGSEVIGAVEDWLTRYGVDISDPADEDEEV